jgi:hypothetical protein
MPELRIDHPSYFHFKGKEAEEFVHELGSRTFLTDWCFPNPKLPNGKELCDFLVVYDNTAIVWQIKNLKLDDSGLHKTGEVEKNHRQLLGAYRSLFERKLKIVLQNAKRRPEEFDSGSIEHVYLVSAMMGSEPEYYPAITVINDKIIHNFTRQFSEIVLNELDTIADFVHYLSSKRNFVESRKEFFIAGGEEELLAVYLLNERSFAQFEKADLVVLEPGGWDHVVQRPEYKRKKKEDRYSYLWDSVIERAHEGSEEYEFVARELARPNRFERRMLGKAMFDAWVTADGDKVHPIYRRMVCGRHATYCFLFMDEAEGRENRKQTLFAMCVVARDTFKDNSKVIGIASEKRIQDECSYDYWYLIP